MHVPGAPPPPPPASAWSESTRQKHVGLKMQFSAGLSRSSSLESHVLPGLHRLICELSLAVFQEQAARFGQSATRARKRVGTRRVGFYAPARPYAFCNSSRRAARPLTLGVGINMPWTAVRARRAVEALRVAVSGFQATVE